MKVVVVNQIQEAWKFETERFTKLKEIRKSSMKYFDNPWDIQH